MLFKFTSEYDIGKLSIKYMLGILKKYASYYKYLHSQKNPKKNPKTLKPLFFTECESGYYKKNSGNTEVCRKCPGNSVSIPGTAYKCECVYGFQRANATNLDEACIGLLFNLLSPYLIVIFFILFLKVGGLGVKSLFKIFIELFRKYCEDDTYGSLKAPPCSTNKVLMALGIWCFFDTKH